MSAADPGATPVTTRVLSPDLARGGMLLLIALANVRIYLYGHSLGARGYPRDLDGADRVVALLQMTLVDGRAYPLFGLLFGYGITQLARRRADVAMSARAVTALVRRRGLWLLVIGLLHGVLLWAGDIVGIYGLLAVLMAGLLVRGSDQALLATAAIGLALTTLLYASSGLPPPGDPQAFFPSMTVADPTAALVARSVEWPPALFNAFGLFASVAFGAWAARRRILDEPERHRTVLLRVAAVGMAAAVLGGLPLALMAAQLWTSPPFVAVLLAGAAHALGGYLGGMAYAALFGLLVIRLAGRTGPLVRALQACGQRSLSCYLAQSVAFVALFPAWTLALGAQATLWQAALVAVGTWLVILAVAAASDHVGYRGPAEILLRRLTYGRRRATVGS